MVGTWELSLLDTSGLRSGGHCQVSGSLVHLCKMLTVYSGLNRKAVCSSTEANPVMLLILQGTLLTFVQFLFVASTGYISQFDRNRPPLFLKPNKVPIRRWLINILLFFTINVLNNHAFSYNISVPIHIILRSGGSITTLAAGYLWGKRFSRLQVFAVMLLTIGVVIAAWSDQQAKVRLFECPIGQD